MLPECQACVESSVLNFGLLERGPFQRPIHSTHGSFGSPQKKKREEETLALLTRQDENERRIERDVGQQGQVVERVLLGPGPDADGQDAQAQELQDIQFGVGLSFKYIEQTYCSTFM
jgi:hypothetical protein